RCPHAIAVVAADSRLSYAELDRRANRLAHFLRRSGVGPETAVGICLQRSCDLIVALLAVFKAGAAYVPLDPHYPAHRLAFMAADAGLHLLLSESSLLQTVAAAAAPVICLDRAWSELATESALEPEAGAAPDNLAYVIYTSGSTGQPKGVGISHRSAVAMLAWAASELTPEELGGMLATTSVCFDLSVYELMVPLSQGGKVILIEDALA